MSWMNSIVHWLKDIELWLYEAYLEAFGWIVPFKYLANPILYVSRGFGWLAHYFGQANNWLVWANSEIDRILNWGTIRSYILSWFSYISDIGSIFYYFGQNVLRYVSTWWSATQDIVMGLISVAVQPFKTLLTAWDNFWNNTWPGWMSSFNSLIAAWDNFWNVTLPYLVSFDWLEIWWDSKILDIQRLMNSTLETWFPFYDSLEKLWSSITEFFTDPLTYLEKRFTDWFLGGE